ncbi:hypothetical protein [Stackebrandtia nassauensis]|uniref:DUF2306 domain-containing protein n=1 Tax=Stackebrandtia nassauensis (strain DSM 44728 / CIP 108903 / NRRL B-16338 / NBRC 102104 / LLR-40K-21) TaxID=446470 RepID=D3PVI1_STANL|nr:hypothetical protein [Stackebrandtia nassauensis]ADD43095.1 conserved hypothetical protein [Stackebrandtia nassauensis DSM 44728]
MVLNLLIGVHISAGLLAVGCGAAAMVVRKQPVRHPWLGRTYLTALVGLVVTAIGLVTFRPHTAYLLLLGTAALATAGIGFAARRMRWRGWLRHHLAAMGTSYILMLTAFYVDNGPRLPLWNLLPPLMFWFLPALVGLPLLLWALARHRIHPNNRRPLRRSPEGGTT